VAVRLLHAPPLRRKSKQTGGSVTTSSPLPFLAGGDLQYKKNTSKVSGSLFSDLLLPPSFFRSGSFGSVFLSFFLLLVADGSGVRAEAFDREPKES